MKISLCMAVLIAWALSANAQEMTPFAAADLLKQPELIPELLNKGELLPEQIPNPHYQGDACTACHFEDGIGKGELRTNDKIRLCTNCHELDRVNALIHAVGMVPSNEKFKAMPAPFKEAVVASGGKLTCIACHDLKQQCLERRWKEKGLNPLFFRGGPYRSRTDLCFNCHEKKNYERFNPHDQIDDQGELVTTRCYACHSEPPDREKAKSINEVKFQVAEELATLCTGCHPRRAHPGGGWASFLGSSNGDGPNHLILPPEPIRQRMAEQAELKGIIMPLEPKTGKIFCGTCHNPHERGVQVRPAADAGSDGRARLRLQQEMICIICHDK